MSEVGSMETGKADDKMGRACSFCGARLSGAWIETNGNLKFCGIQCDKSYAAGLTKPLPDPSPDKWDALKRAAEAATPGPWYVHWGPKNPYIKTVGTEWYVMDQNPMAPFVRRDPDANYIAQANPAAILELLSELRGMERGGEGQWIEIKEGGDMPPDGCEPVYVWVVGPECTTAEVAYWSPKRNWCVNAGGMKIEGDENYPQHVTHWQRIKPPQSGVDGREK